MNKDALFLCIALALAAPTFAFARQQAPPSNAIFVILPYRYAGTWVFDDEARGLVKEPFVSGIPQMMDQLVEDIPNADEGFRLLFSATPFPGYSMKVVRKRADMGGYWYASEELKMEGWLCPALFKYFSEPPQEIYVKAEPR